MSTMQTVITRAANSVAQRWVAQSPKVGNLAFRRGWGRQIARLNARPSPYLRGQVGSMENIVKIVNSLQED